MRKKIDHSVYIGFVREVKPDFFSTVIMWAQGKPFSHVYVRNDEWALHAIEHGVMMDKPDALLHDCVRVKEWKVTCLHEPSEDFFEEVQRKFQRSDYSKLQCVGLAIANVLRMRKNPIKNSFKKLICTEFGGVFLRDYCGINPGGDQDLWDLDDIEECLNKYGQLQIDDSWKYK